MMKVILLVCLALTGCAATARHGARPLSEALVGPGECLVVLLARGPGAPPWAATRKLMCVTKHGFRFECVRGRCAMPGRDV